MKRLLVANRGEIARRIFRTAHAMGMATVAVYSDADREALHVRDATLSYALGGLTSADSYLRIDKLLAAAKATGADAVHPGYGFLSENADFAQAVVNAGLTWVGPPPAAIRALGSKASAKRLALAQGVPVLPGYQGEDQRDERFAQEAQRIGCPVMVKATAGGGGRGMRLVKDPAQLAAALASARSEALSSFGSAELLIERALLAPRHVEVQVFADALGHCIHLGERDCSVQRRHQKIIEESPSPAVGPALREQMGRCAVALAQAAGYVGAGTVEFLVDMPGDEEGAAAAPGRPKQGTAPSGGSEPHAVGSVGAFYLMEMNTRLQVEHPVTELVTGLDLVEWQLRVARGEPLPLTQDQVQFQGHAVEVRLCAEDAHFMPHTGTVQRFVPPTGVRFDHALADGQAVSPHYDAMLGKLIAHGPDRHAALDRLHAALARTEVLGLPTNRAFLQACVAHPVFRAGQALIPFLAEQGDGLRATLAQAALAPRLVACVAVHLAHSPASHGLPLPFGKPLRFEVDGDTLALTVLETGPGALQLSHQGQTHAATWQAIGPQQSHVTLDGVGHAVARVALPDGRWHLQVDGAELWLQDLSWAPPAAAVDAGQGAELRAPFNGKLIALPQPAGSKVRRGDTLAVVESMKLEHALPAPCDGVVAAVAVALGQQLAPGQRLLTVEVAA